MSGVAGLGWPDIPHPGDWTESIIRFEFHLGCVLGALLSGRGDCLQAETPPLWRFHKNRFIFITLTENDFFVLTITSYSREVGYF
jgi:hypothetical protein